MMSATTSALGFHRREQKLTAPSALLEAFEAAPKVKANHLYEVRPRKDERGVDLIFRCAAIRSVVVWRA